MNKRKKQSHGPQIGTVIGNTSPQEYSFLLKSFSAKLGDIVVLEMEIPSEKQTTEAYPRESILVWGRIVELERFNPFLPTESAKELSEEGIDLLDTVLSYSQDQIQGQVLVLGSTPVDNLTDLVPLNYPIEPGSIVELPPASKIKQILNGKEASARMKIGSLIGRRDVNVELLTNVLVSRHMAILAMTGGGKTVASRQVISELLKINYPLLILDPHGDYLGFWDKRDKFPDAEIKLYFPDIKVNEQNRDIVSYLISRMTRGYSEAQLEKYEDVLESVKINEKDNEKGIPIADFINRVIRVVESRMNENGDNNKMQNRTLSVVKRNLKNVLHHMEAMNTSNMQLRKRLSEYPFEAMPDPQSEPEQFIRPGRASILYLGGYDHLTQSTIVSIILKSLFDVRASMSNKIPPFFCIVEEAHNFIPSKGEGQAETPSVEIIRKIITEGRKFGCGLLLVSQRPSRLDETTLSQCNTFLIFRLVNPKDQTFIKSVMENLTSSDAKLIPGFGPGQGIISGQSVRFPLVIKVDFDEDLKPKTIGDEDFVELVKKWDSSPGAEKIRRSEIIEKGLDDLP
ncbi:DUF87 domain-containing protein [Leptospira sp. WS58.C1]|uniref:helicase HerA domain-containing protein n=1 Tax=Leptospira cinconiae TaxID=3235173 RepID=UPI00349EB294